MTQKTIELGQVYCIDEIEDNHLGYLWYFEIPPEFKIIHNYYQSIPLHNYQKRIVIIKSLAIGDYEIYGYHKRLWEPLFKQKYLLKISVI